MKEIEVSFTIRIALERTDVHWVEEELLWVRQEVFKRVIEEIEGQELKRERCCERCGSVLVKNGRDRKEIKTLVGRVKIERVRLRCQRCRQDIYPLDQLLGLASGERVTMGVRERSLWAALEEGRRIQRWEEQRRRVVFEQAREEEGARRVPEVLYIQVDGTGVNDRASGQWMECKVGRVLVSGCWYRSLGCCWCRRSTIPILKLRLLKFNREWDTYWHERYREHARYAA